MADARLTSVDRIERELILAILRGAYPPGARLPTMRALATRFDVNLGTVQRAVARLEARRLVHARQGSGVTVDDPWLQADIGLMPLWLEATLDRPDAAAALLDEFLEIRRTIAAHLVSRHRARIAEAMPRLLERASALHGPGGVDASVAERDIAFARELVAATGNRAALAVLNTARRVVALPTVARAMYADPRRNVAAMVRVLESLVGDGAADPGDVVRRELAELDAATVERFRHDLENAA